MANQYVNKVIVDGQVKLDLTADTVTSDKILRGYTTHDKSGTPITGDCDFDTNTSDATAGAAEILKDKTAYVTGNKVIGTMTNNGAVTGTISTKTGQYTVPKGYHDGSGKVGISSAEQAKIIPDNIREGINILGVIGTMSALESVIVAPLSVTPTFSEQHFSPSEGTDYFSQVTVAAIPMTESDNAQGGITITIG